jgi:hypothetical protein
VGEQLEELNFRFTAMLFQEPLKTFALFALVKRESAHPGKNCTTKILVSIE